MSHFLLGPLHRLCAMIFVGTVFFEIFILDDLRSSLSRDEMRKVAIEVGRRLRRLMPFVLAILYSAGIAMAWGYRDVLA